MSSEQNSRMTEGRNGNPLVSVLRHDNAAETLERIGLTLAAYSARRYSLGYVPNEVISRHRSDIKLSDLNEANIRDYSNTLERLYSFTLNDSSQIQLELEQGVVVITHDSFDKSRSFGTDSSAYKHDSK